MTLPLDGVLVVSAEQALAAPYASRHLADLGATVIKVERPDGGDFARRYDRVVGGMSSAFVWLNRSKKSLTLDLNHPRSAAVFDRLLDRADVFLHNLKPTSAARLGLHAEELQAKHERLIVCEISGYGDAGGRFRDKKAYDLMIQAELGLLSITGTPDEPARVGISVADIAAGSYALSSVLGALFERERTGVARRISISLLDSLAEWMGHPLYYSVHSGTQPPRTGTSHALISPYGAFAVGDGATVMLAVQNEREWKRFSNDVLRRPDLVDDERFSDNAARVAHRAELARLVEDAFVARTVDEVLDSLDSALIANARLNSVLDFVNEYQQVAPGRWAKVTTPSGPVDVMVSPLRPAEAPVAFDWVPSLGQHTTEVLLSIGLSAEEIAELRAQSVFGVEP